MLDSYLPFSKPTLSDAAIQEVIDCLKSGWLATGPRVKKFEDMLKDYLGAPHAPTFNSGTAGLHSALLAMNLKPDDEVIVPAMTFVASANSVILAGARPVLVDVDLHTYNTSIEHIEKAITKKTKVIMPVHFAGLSVDLDPIYDLAKKHNIFVLEDAAHAIGTEYKGKRIGSFGDAQMFSFHPNKNITTAEGGCVTTRDDDLAKGMSVYRFHGIDRDAFNRFSKEGSQHYDVIAPGLKYNMTDLQAAIGIHQLPELDRFIELRTKQAHRYLSAFGGGEEGQAQDLPLQMPLQPSTYENKHAWHLFTPLINPEKAGMTRDEFMNRLKTFNIGTGFHYDALHSFSLYRNRYGYKKGDFPNTEKIAERIVSLPLFPLLTEEEQTAAINAIKKVLNHD